MPDLPDTTIRSSSVNERPQVGFVGLGAMGSRMAKRLLDAGYSVIGYNRTRARAQSLLDAGLRWAQSPREAAAASEVVFTSVTDPAALEAVTGGPDGILAGLRPGAVFIDTSTVSPSLSRRLAEEVRRRGGAMLDAPVSGAPPMIEQGRLVIMVGGDAAVFDRVKPLLEAIGPTVTHVGPNGRALLLKLAINLSVAGQFHFFAEGLALALKGGVPLDKALDVMLNSVIASGTLKYRGPFVAQMPKQAWFSVAMMQKDLVLALEEARRLGVPLPATAVTNELLSAAISAGLAQEDLAAVFRVLERLANTG